MIMSVESVVDKLRIWWIHAVENAHAVVRRWMLPLIKM